MEQPEKHTSEKSEYYEFPCGCKFKILGPPKTSDGLPQMKVDYLDPDFNLHCPATWDLIKSGRTLGVFQLDSHLGQAWAEKTEPSSIEETGDLVALMRPGVLNAKQDGISMAEHYALRKKGLEENVSKIPSLQPILQETQNVILFQETIIRIASEICGFTLEEADSLRKAVGKKLADKLMSVKEPFIEGAKKVGAITESEAEEVFEWILASARYSFNKSHAISYSIRSYWTAYAKVHFPMHFHAAYMTMAKDRQTKKAKDQIRDIVKDAKLDNINTLPPDLRKIRRVNGMFAIEQPNKIYFGHRSVKGVGDSKYTAILEKIQGVKISEMDWLDVLFFLCQDVSSDVSANLIKSGSLDYLGLDRRQMLLEYEIISTLDDRQINFFKQNKGADIVDTIKIALAKNIELVKQKDKNRPFYNARSVDKVNRLLDRLANPGYDPADQRRWILVNEKELLGIPLSIEPTSGVDRSMCNSNCLSAVEHPEENMLFLASIASERTFAIKKGKNAGKRMCVMKLEDEFGQVEAILWPDVLDEYEQMVYEGSLLYVYCKPHNKKQVTIEKLCQI